MLGMNLRPVMAIAITAVLSSSAMRVQAADWTRFRGSSGTGLAPAADKLPTEIAPGQNQIWRTELPPGHSSPVIVGNRIFVTAVRGEREKELFTMCLDRATGKIQWEAKAPYQKLEEIHTIGSHEIGRAHV